MNSNIKNIVMYVKNNKYIRYIILFILIISIGIIIYTYISTPKNIKNYRKIVDIKDIDIKKINKCPDYWDVDKVDNVINTEVCNNTHNLGVCKDENGDKIKNIDFNTYLDTSDPAINNNPFNLKKKCQWAKKCRVTWDILDSIC